MDLGRLRGTDYVVGVLAAALLGTLFLPWFEPPFSGAYFDGSISDPLIIFGDVTVPPGESLNAFEAYTVTDIVLALFAVMALGIVFFTATQRTSAMPVAWTALTASVSLIATGFMAVAALTVPEDGLVREVGPVLGLALTLGLTGAVWSTMRSERPGPALARSPRAEVETLHPPQP